MSAQHEWSSDVADEQVAREDQNDPEVAKEGHQTAPDRAEPALLRSHAGFAPSTTAVRKSRPPIHGAIREDTARRAERVKASCRIEDVVRSYGVSLTSVGGGRRYVGLCPFHGEEHASFTVYPETQSFCCYGCHAAGDVIAFVCRLKGVGFDEALRLLGEAQIIAPGSRSIQFQKAPNRNEQWGSDSRDYDADGQPPLAMLPPTESAACPALGEPSRDQFSDSGELAPGPDEAAHGTTQAQASRNASVLRLTLLSVTTALAMQALASAPLALTYLGERGISYSLARRCRLGYLEETALAEYLADDTEFVQVAQEIGLLSRFGNGTLTRRLIVPEIRRSRATQLIGRVVPGARTPMPGVKYYLVCGSREKGLLGYGAALERLERRSGHPERQREGRDLLGILVLEGALDYVVAVGWDLPVLPVALLSAYPSRAQVRELLDLHARSGGLPFLLLLDADGAGRQGTQKFVSMLRAHHAPFRALPPLPRLPLPATAYKDLGELGPLGQEGRRQLLVTIGEALGHADAQESAGWL